MANSPDVFATGRDLPSDDTLRKALSDMLDQARSLGADAAEATLSASRALSVSVRGQERESIEFEGDRSASVTVYRGGSTGAAATTDLSADGLKSALAQANTIARFTEADRYAGLADRDRMASHWPELDLFHPWSLAPDAAEELALEIEAAALGADARIAQTEGATVSSEDAISGYANSHGFVGLERASRHVLSCTAIARAADGNMQREIAYSQARASDALAAPVAVGKLAAERALGRLDARRVTTGRAPVLFVPRVARSLWGHVFGAISGGALYRNASFLKDRLGESIAVPALHIWQHPHRARGLASAGFDGDGVATAERALIDGGVLAGYLLSSYSARRLGMETTGNAGGVFNADIAPGDADFDALVAGMGRGLVVTELMGQGVNLVTGDYSRGAAGWWVENGELAYPIENATVAGNLGDMLQSIEVFGADVDDNSSVRTPSVVVGGLTIAGG